jgi:hypothetical protein
MVVKQRVAKLLVMELGVSPSVNMDRVRRNVKARDCILKHLLVLAKYVPI